MRIFLDARYVQADFTGIGVFALRVIEALAKADRENEYIVLLHSSYRESLELPENFEVIHDSARPVSLRTILSLHRLVKRHNADLLHSLLPLAPMFWRGKLVTTVFDLQPLLVPQFTGGRSPAKKFLYDLYYNTVYPMSLRKADYLLTTSYSTKDDLAVYFPDAAQKVYVVHGGVDPECFEPLSEELIERVREKFDIPKRFLFYLGSTRPNKNLPMMLDAFEEFHRTHPEYDDLVWVMVVNPDRFFDPVFARIRERGLLKRIHIHEQVTEQEKRVFYHLASLLYLVTKYEGFGLPVLEAQAQGTPVMASTHGSLPEVAGQAAILCDPDDRDSIVAGLNQFFGDPELRAQMILMGRENAGRFSWDKTAKEFLDIYNHLLA